ncbi:MAG: PssD/Cps14F family polysaccharide biosynthesis glycosyltransferase [archaeon]|jgi:UDP-N-acetylglucosamine:LPS N-acetylglucosamine transferase|nr:PssD/Cps14F family polysaccharide biosynthesis glycosyltransferase [archaeon]
MKVCLACSAGGHLTELIQLENAWKEKTYYFVSDRRGNAIELAKREKVEFVYCPRRNPIKLVANFFQSLWIFLKERPNVVVSTGADTAIATCLIAKLFGKRVIFIESFCRIKSASLSGKIMYRLADLFLVQWPENKKFFPKAVYSGSVF